ncbi:hypothetical protein PROH_14635 [Prochlorothrix hollandica PCC 9006 = CALU 1027]|uniref:Glycosyltransferase 2-like domain-containing protein n=2 Tax=Prochlorothrix hollandica TaxID=1223 RepID=A0A0M2PVA1_PROHO|nr:hypothetical protein PROH_14635 [Prochlorothrix hollandica PCC 9006 = CALU 1027]
MILMNYPQVHLIHATNHDFWTGATNLGVSYALKHNAEYILTINDDAYVSHNYVSSLVKLIDKYNLDILGSRIDHMGQPGLIWSLGAYCRWGSKDILQLAYGQCWIDNLPQAIILSEFFQVDSLPGNGVLIKSPVFKKIGLYNQIFLPHYHADSEFIMRANKNGIISYITPQIIVYNDFDLEAAHSSAFSDFFSRKSHLFIVPIIYIIFNYCPWSLKMQTFFYTCFYPSLKYFQCRYIKILNKSRVLLKKSIKKITFVIFSFVK